MKPPLPAPPSGRLPVLRPSRAGAALALALGALPAGCAPETPRERFEREVVPALERRCASAACHGVAPSAELRGEVIDRGQLFLPITSDGRIADVDNAYSITKTRINTVERPELSSLLRKPLARALGGEPHLGGVVFEDRETPDYLSIRDWIAEEDGGGEGGDIDDLPPTQGLFAKSVLPHLEQLQCLNGPCHGPTAPFTSFQPPVPIDGETVFSRDAALKNHAAARMHLFLGGSPLLSRLVRKGLALDRGGISHRGGNDIFFSRAAAGDPTADPAVAAILEWAELEQAETLGGPPGLAGIVLVAGPVGPSGPFSHAGFVPGTDLFVLPAGAAAPVNVTAHLHPDGPADIRDPAVRHDGARIAFAMRKSADDAHNLYEIGTGGEDPIQLTQDAGALPGGGRLANVEPTYGPDGRIYFVSTRAGQMDDRSSTLDTEIWAVDPVTRALTRETHDPALEGAPAFIPAGKSYGTLSFTVLRTIGGRHESAVFRAPLDHNKKYHGDPELHAHHGITSGADIVLDMRTLPDGRFAATLLDREAMWRGGALTVFDRQLGPDLHGPDSGAPSVGGFRHAFARLDLPPNAEGQSVRFARRPVPLPDGRILVTLAHGDADPLDPSSLPDLGLYVLTLAEDRASLGPVVTASERLLDDPSLSERDAQPIVARPLEDDPAHERAWDPSASTGRLAYRHVETLEAIMSHLPPSGPRPLRDDIEAVRLIEAVPVTPKDLEQGPLSLGGHTRARVLAETPVLGGSLFLDVPAGRPFRIQTLDARGMAVGAQHNRWIDVAPGQTFPGGVSPILYPTLCAGCHGTLSGDPAESAGPVPDVVTAASITQATHEGLDPRRPRAPVPVGQAPIEVDFAIHVAPILAASCATANCHSAAAPAGGLDLSASPTEHFDSAYEALLAPGPGSGGGRKYVDEAGSSARNSYLIERVFGLELDAPAPAGGACPGDPPVRGRAHDPDPMDRARRDLPRGRAVTRALVPLLAASLGACSFPEIGEEPLVLLDREAFEAEVQPVLEARCANPSCHGRPERPLSTFAPGRYRASAGDTYADTPLTPAELTRNYLSSCALAAYEGRPEDALLVAKPLAAVHYHGGDAVFAGDRDTDYRTLVAWIAAGPEAP